MGRNRPTDQSWPPLGVQDLKPDASCTPEKVKFQTLRDALVRAARARTTKEQP